MKHEITQWKCLSGHTFFLWPYMVSCGALQWPLNIRWCWCTPTCHWLCDITLSSNGLDCQYHFGTIFATFNTVHLGETDVNENWTLKINWANTSTEFGKFQIFVCSCFWDIENRSNSIEYLPIYPSWGLYVVCSHNTCKHMFILFRLW